MGASCATVPPATPVAAVTAAPPLLTPAPVADTDAALLEEISQRFHSRQTGLGAVEIAKLARTILETSRRHDIDPALVLAVIHVESRYNAFIVSRVGAMGLMQILPATGKELASKLGIDWLGPQTLFDPSVNVQLGVAYLRELSDRFGSTHVALAAYNWGPGHIGRRIRRGTPLPKIYSELVFEAYQPTQQRES
jgi:soluble lytic murein transglycosylase-like protein